MRVLGIDTSNYTTSAALVDETGFRQERRLLSVGEGERGLRQRDALFLHTVNLPKLMHALSPMGKIDAVAYSAYPRDAEGSYMPCFLAGEASGEAVSAALGVPAYRFSHQAGHLMAAVKTCGCEKIGESAFLAFHLSGGTTELLHVWPDERTGFAVDIIGRTLDISAGQLIDRVGVMLGLPFPCGGALERLAEDSNTVQPVRVCVKGADCNMSGAENMAEKLFENGIPACDIARFAIDFVTKTVVKMSEAARIKYPSLPILYVGGVMRNAAIRLTLTAAFSDIWFAETELSSDNAVGTAYLGLARLKRERICSWKEES